MGDAADSRDEKGATCPIPQAHGRLHQAHRLWHILQEAYPTPDDFVIHLNAALEAFRNVTFILQNEMKVIPHSKEWYEEWQERMKADEVMKWAGAARTTVVHKGDLATYSTATVSVRASWFGPIEMGTLEVPPLVPTEAIAVLVKEELKPGALFQREGVLERYELDDLADRLRAHGAEAHNLSRDEAFMASSALMVEVESPC